MKGREKDKERKKERKSKWISMREREGETGGKRGLAKEMEEKGRQ